MVDDSKLLNYCNVTTPQNNMWLFKEFKKCEDRLFGVIARWIYIWGGVRYDDNISRIQSVSLLGYDDTEKNSVMNAINRMKRIYLDNVSQADLVFVNFRVGTDKHLIYNQLETLISQTSPNTVIIVRCGFYGPTVAQENLTEYFMTTYMLIYTFLKEANVIFGTKVVCTLPDRRHKLYKSFLHNVVSLSEGNVEEWLPLSLSNEDILNL